MKKFLLLLAFTPLTFTVLAQLPFIGRGPTISVGAQLAVPQGEFSDFYKSTPYGMNASGSFPIFKLPLEIGGGFAWNSIAGEGKNVSVSDEFGNVQSANLDINGNAYTYYAHARLRPFKGRFRPYAEVLAGVRNYSVKSKLQFDNNPDGDPFTEVNDRDYAWVSGWAVGLQYRVIKGIFIEGRFEKLHGDRAQYINPASISINDDGAYSYANHESRTDQLTFSLGLAFSF